MNSHEGKLTAGNRAELTNQASDVRAMCTLDIRDERLNAAGCLDANLF
jgi:hypothetical protein